MVADTKPVFAKAYDSIVVTEFGISTSVRSMLFWKAQEPIQVTELPIVKELSLQAKNAPLPIWTTELGIITEVTLTQPAKVCSPIDVTEVGIVTEASSLQPQKVKLPIEVVASGISIELRLQP